MMNNDIYIWHNWKFGDNDCFELINIVKKELLNTESKLGVALQYLVIDINRNTIFNDFCQAKTLADVVKYISDMHDVGNYEFIGVIPNAYKDKFTLDWYKQQYETKYNSVDYDISTNCDYHSDIVLTV